MEVKNSIFRRRLAESTRAGDCADSRLMKQLVVSGEQ
jgi:hypothetical protein